MARYVSSRNPISATSLKRRPLGSVIRHHIENWEDIKFTRVSGGWLREREDCVWVKPAVIISSADVARECNKAIGDKHSWVRIY